MIFRCCRLAIRRVRTRQPFVIFVPMASLLGTAGRSRLQVRVEDVEFRTGQPGLCAPPRLRAAATPIAAILVPRSSLPESRISSHPDPSYHDLPRRVRVSQNRLSKSGAVFGCRRVSAGRTIASPAASSGRIVDFLRPTVNPDRRPVARLAVHLARRRRIPLRMAPPPVHLPSSNSCSAAPDLAAHN
jgi:hypothetical protein